MAMGIRNGDRKRRRRCLVRESNGTRLGCKQNDKRVVYNNVTQCPRSQQGGGFHNLQEMENLWSRLLTLLFGTSGPLACQMQGPDLVLAANQLCIHAGRG